MKFNNAVEYSYLNLKQTLYNNVFHSKKSIIMTDRCQSAKKFICNVELNNGNILLFFMGIHII